jgi:hypothetical protein
VSRHCLRHGLEGILRKDIAVVSIIFVLSLTNSSPFKMEPFKVSPAADGANVVSEDTDTEATTTESLVDDEYENSLPANNRCTSSSWTVMLADRNELFPPLPLELQHVVPVERWHEFCLGGQATLQDRYRPDLCNACLAGFWCCTLLLAIFPGLNSVLEIGDVWVVFVFVPAICACYLFMTCFFGWYQRQSAQHTRARLIEFCLEQETAFFKDQGMSLQFVSHVQDCEYGWFARVNISHWTSSNAKHDDVEEVA